MRPERKNKMKKKMIYFVTFDVYKNRTAANYIFFCEAQNAKEAKEIAKKIWSASSRRTSFQFHLYSKKSNIQDTQLLRAKNWAGKEHKGPGVMNRFICREFVYQDFQTWRVEGKNMYEVR